MEEHHECKFYVNANWTAYSRCSCGSTYEQMKMGLNKPLYKSHKLGDKYKMDGKGDWKIAYYPISEDGKTGEKYNEPRALIETPMKNGTDFREVPLRYLTRIV